MKNLFIEYFYVFFNPFKAHQAYLNNERTPLRFFEVLLISWLFKVIKSVYFFIGIHLIIGLLSIKTSSLAVQKLSESKFAVYSVLVGAIFYPLVFWMIVKFWNVLLKFFYFLYVNEECPKSSFEKVSLNAMTAQACLLVPVVGEVLAPITFFFFLFAGMRSLLRFSVLQSLLVLIAPLFLFLLFITILISYILFLVSVF